MSYSQTGPVDEQGANVTVGTVTRLTPLTNKLFA